MVHEVRVETRAQTPGEEMLTPRERSSAALLKNAQVAIGIGALTVATALGADAAVGAFHDQSGPALFSLDAAGSWVAGLAAALLLYPVLRIRRRRIETFAELGLAGRRLAEYRRRDEEEQEKKREATLAIDRCLAERAITVLFQPIVSTHDGFVIGAEALARFADGRPPDQWFREAVSVGRGVQLELLAIELALEEAARNLPDDTYLSINMSPTTMASPSLRPILHAETRSLVVEMTEHEPLEMSAELTEALRWFRARGGRVAADDAGNGYAGLSHLLMLAPDIIKLDRALVTGVDGDAAKRALVLAVTGFAYEIDASVVAEGVETAEELRSLVGVGVDAVQGYLLGRPTELPLDTTPRPGLGRPTVIVVDSDPSVRQTLAAILRRSGFEVVADAHDGPSAIRCIRVLRPDAVILDQALPGIGGTEVLYRVRSLSPGTTVVGFSARASVEFQRALDGFLSKTDLGALVKLPDYLYDWISQRREAGRDAPTTPNTGS